MSTTIALSRSLQLDILQLGDGGAHQRVVCRLSRLEAQKLAEELQNFASGERKKWSVTTRPYSVFLADSVTPPARR